jgi:hypothetical protein
MRPFRPPLGETSLQPTNNFEFYVAFSAKQDESSRRPSRAARRATRSPSGPCEEASLPMTMPDAVEMAYLVTYLALVLTALGTYAAFGG